MKSRSQRGREDRLVARAHLIRNPHFPIIHPVLYYKQAPSASEVREPTAHSAAILDVARSLVRWHGTALVGCAWARMATATLFIAASVASVVRSNCRSSP